MPVVVPFHLVLETNLLCLQMWNAPLIECAFCSVNAGGWEIWRQLFFPFRKFIAVGHSAKPGASTIHLERWVRGIAAKWLNVSKLDDSVKVETECEWLKVKKVKSVETYFDALDAHCKYNVCYVQNGTLTQKAHAIVCASAQSVIRGISTQQSRSARARKNNPNSPRHKLYNDIIGKGGARQKSRIQNIVIFCKLKHHSRWCVLRWRSVALFGVIYIVYYLSVLSRSLWALFGVGYFRDNVRSLSDETQDAAHRIDVSAVSAVLPQSCLTPISLDRLLASFFLHKGHPHLTGSLLIAASQKSWTNLYSVYIYMYIRKILVVCCPMPTRILSFGKTAAECQAKGGSSWILSKSFNSLAPQFGRTIFLSFLFVCF